MCRLNPNHERFRKDMLRDSKWPVPSSRPRKALPVTKPRKLVLAVEILRSLVHPKISRFKFALSVRRCQPTNEVRLWITGNLSFYCTLQGKAVRVTAKMCEGEGFSRRKLKALTQIKKNGTVPAPS